MLTVLCRFTLTGLLIKPDQYTHVLSCCRIVFYYLLLFLLTVKKTCCCLQANSSHVVSNYRMSRFVYVFCFALFCLFF